MRGQAPGSVSERQREGVAPPGGAHRDPAAMRNAVKKAVEAHLSTPLELPLDELLQQRHKKSRRMGVLGGE